jgi:DNA-binding SARP family transcriptional activator
MYSCHDLNDAIDVGILGPLFVRVGSLSAVPTAPKLRNVLTTLLVHAGHMVPGSALITELWDEHPPRSGLTTLQTYILSLRKLLAATTGRPVAQIASDTLITQAGGYLFQIDTGNLDLHRYHRLLAQGRQALADGDDHLVVRRFGEALRVWRGPALVDVPGGRVLETKRRELEESRLVAVEYLVDAQLRLGRYREVLPELVALTHQNPLHEGFQAQYMRALHHSGRRAQALEVYRDLRTTMIDELGLEPGPEVQQLHHAILTCDHDPLPNCPT